MISLFSKGILDHLQSNLGFSFRFSSYPVVAGLKQVEDAIIRIPIGLNGEGYTFKHDVMWIESRERAVLMIEDWGTTTPDDETYESRFRLLGMVNLKKLSPVMSTADRVALEIRNLMPDSIQMDMDDSVHALVQFVGFIPKQPTIFARYTIEEQMKQILLWPYDYFALEYKLTFRIGAGCLDPIKEEDGC